MARVWAITFLVIQVMGLILLALPAMADRAIGKGKPAEHWSMLTNVGRTQNLYKVEGEPGSASYDFAINPTILLNRDYSVYSLIETSQDTVNDEYDYGRGLLGIKKYSGFHAIGKRIKMVPRFVLGFPLSKGSQDASLNVATTAGLYTSVNSDFLITKKLSIGFDLSMTRNFHEYETNKENKYNTKYSSVQGLLLGWSFTDWLSLGVEGYHYDTVSYSGTYQDFLSHKESLSFQINPRWSVGVGHVWGAPYVSSRKANGQDLNLNLSDETNSLVYIDTTFVL